MIDSTKMLQYQLRFVGLRVSYNSEMSIFMHRVFFGGESFCHVCQCFDLGDLKTTITSEYDLIMMLVSYKIGP